MDDDNVISYEIDTKPQDFNLILKQDDNVDTDKVIKETKSKRMANEFDQISKRNKSNYSEYIEQINESYIRFQKIIEQSKNNVKFLHDVKFLYMNSKIPKANRNLDILLRKNFYVKIIPITKLNQNYMVVTSNFPKSEYNIYRFKINKSILLLRKLYGNNKILDHLLIDDLLIDDLIFICLIKKIYYIFIDGTNNIKNINSLNQLNNFIQETDEAYLKSINLDYLHYCLDNYYN